MRFISVPLFLKKELIKKYFFHLFFQKCIAHRQSLRISLSSKSSSSSSSTFTPPSSISPSSREGSSAIPATTTTSSAWGMRRWVAACEKVASDLWLCGGIVLSSRASVCHFDTPTLENRSQINFMCNFLKSHFQFYKALCVTAGPAPKAEWSKVLELELAFSHSQSLWISNRGMLESCQWLAVLWLNPIECCRACPESWVVSSVATWVLSVSHHYLGFNSWSRYMRKLPVNCDYVVA